MYPAFIVPTSKRWLLLDCWATWCVPCRKQRLFLEKFEEKYKDSIEFVFLSLDENKELWQKFVTKSKNGAKNQYLVKGGFKSELANYFNLLTIPRYTLLDISKKAVAAKDLPIPIQPQGFEKAISEAIGN
ncbi:MAG TPA: thioredoxin family protein [Flavisolibacter sp.]|nr:thioredoxin family protein [Flavisolibacter sp.]